MRINEVKEFFTQSQTTLKSVINNINKEAPLLQSESLTQIQNTLESEEKRDSLGLIRVLFLGAASSGKSAMINFLANKIIVPEVMHTSTLIPTWIGPSNEIYPDGVKVTYFKEDTAKHKYSNTEKIELHEKPETMDDFRCYYCYTPEDIADRARKSKRRRFIGMNLNEAYLRLPNTHTGIFSDYSLVLVDSLGHGVSPIDDEKAKHNMKNCDFAFVLLDAFGNLDDADLKFFSTTLLNPDISKINPSHIIFIINKIDTSPSVRASKQNAKNTITALLNRAFGNAIPEGLEDKLHNQIVPFSALFARLHNKLIYPYQLDCEIILQEMTSMSEEEKSEEREIASEKKDFERRTIAENSTEQLKRRSYLDEFTTALSTKVNELFKDRTISNNHLTAIKEYASQIQKAIDAQFNALMANSAQIDATITRFEVAKQNISTSQEETSRICREAYIEFPQAINKYLKDHYKEISNISAPAAIEVINKIRINVIRGDYTRRRLRQMTSTDIKREFIPSFEKPMNEVVKIICNAIFEAIFTEAHDVNTSNPYNKYIINIINQTIKNHIETTLNKLRTIGADADDLLYIVENKVLRQKIDESLNVLKLTMMSNFNVKIFDVSNKYLNERIKARLTPGFFGTIAGLFDSVDDIFDKLETEARVVMEETIAQTFEDNIDSNTGFLDYNTSINITDIIRENIYKSLSIIDKYVNGIDTELKSLLSNQTTFRNQITSYQRTKEVLTGQLNNVIQNLNTLEKRIEKEGVTL